MKSLPPFWQRDGGAAAGPDGAARRASARRGHADRGRERKTAVPGRPGDQAVTVGDPRFSFGQRHSALSECDLAARRLVLRTEAPLLAEKRGKVRLGRTDGTLFAGKCPVSRRSGTNNGTTVRRYGERRANGGNKGFPVRRMTSRTEDPALRARRPAPFRPVRRSGRVRPTIRPPPSGDPVASGRRSRSGRVRPANRHRLRPSGGAGGLPRARQTGQFLRKNASNIGNLFLSAASIMCL